MPIYEDYRDRVAEILVGRPWTPETARRAGFVSLNQARAMLCGLGSAGLFDEDGGYDQLGLVFRELRESLTEDLGVPIVDRSHGRDLVSGFVEYLAFWHLGDRIVYLALESGDNGRLRELLLWETNSDQLQKPIPSTHPPTHPPTF